jgi:hypothetical protein
MPSTKEAAAFTEMSVNGADRMFDRFRPNLSAVNLTKIVACFSSKVPIVYRNYDEENRLGLKISSLKPKQRMHAASDCLEDFMPRFFFLI